MRNLSFCYIVSVALGFYGFVNTNVAAQNGASLQLNASYVGDYVTNMKGGIKTGSAWLGLANLKLGFDTEKAGWWKGGTFFVNAGNTHGGKPSEDLVGDFQGISNIEAGNLTFMYELWYRQQIKNIALTVGLQDLNVDFASTSYGCLFTNSSFGIHSSIADNIPSPIFPLTALGVSLQWQICPNVQWKMALFDGTPDDYQKNPYNIHWRLSKNDGFLAVSEWQLNATLVNQCEGSYKLGVYAHNHCDSTSDEVYNYGVYLVADQQIIKTLRGGIGLFSQIGVSPKKNANNYFLSLGVNWRAPFVSRPDDACGIAFAYAGMHHNGGVGGELSVEATYKFQACRNVYLKPDLQYVVNPAGTGSKLPNALVGLLRLGIEL